MKRQSNGTKGITAWLMVMLLALGFSTTATAQKAIKLGEQRQQAAGDQAEYIGLRQILIGGKS